MNDVIRKALNVDSMDLDIAFRLAVSGMKEVEVTARSSHPDMSHKILWVMSSDTAQQGPSIGKTSPLDNPLKFDQE
jgi:hypothetical protein